MSLVRSRISRREGAALGVRAERRRSMATLRRSTYRRRARCGGGVYLAVLGAATIVTVIGVSALLAVTVQRRISTATGEATAARFHAQAAIELALHQLANDPNWRNTYANNTWAGSRVIADGSLQFKLVDDDGSLGDDPLDAVWLVGRGAVGQAVRMTKVLLKPERSLASANILENGNAEAGTRGWDATGGATLAYLAAEPAEGAGALVLRDRNSASDGMKQDLLGSLTAGQSYDVELWLRAVSSSSSFVIELRTTGVLSGLRSASVTTSTIGNTWTKVSTTLTPTAAGLLLGAELKISTAARTSDFLVDDVRVRPTAATYTMVPVPGTWQQEVQ